METPKHPVVELTDANRHHNMSESGSFCGFTITALEAKHCCSLCGRLASTLTKYWDDGKIVWTKFLCRPCADYQIELQNSKLTTGQDGDNSNA